MINQLKEKLPGSTLCILLFMVVAGVGRLLFPNCTDASYLLNFTPLGAMALYGGAYFTSWKKYAFPLLTLWLSDILLNRYVYYGEWKLFYECFYWTYGAFALMVVTGKYMLTKISIGRVISSTLVITMIHWIVTDLGVWLESSLYPPTLEGFQACLITALPLELYFLTGTLIYGSILFTSFEWLRQKLQLPDLKSSRI